MKSLFQKITATFAVLALLYGSCKNPAKDVEINVSTNIFKSPMLIEFINAKAGAAVPQSFTVTMTGPGAGLVRTSTGAKEFKVIQGYLNLMLDRAAAPSESNPVKFTIIVSAPGFAPTYTDIEVTSETAPMIYRLQMNEYANPAAATGAVVATQAITNGTSAAELKFTTGTNAGMSEKTTITIPTGTGFLDASGQPTGGAQIEARIVYSGVDANGNMTVVPANGHAANVTGSNGQPITGGVYFDPVASVSINMFAGAKEVKSFTKPLTVEVELSSAKINPNTSQPYKENETIPSWSLNTESGQWKQEVNATVVKNASGKLVAQMQITHLSVFVVGYTSAPCTTTVTINRPSDTDFGEVFNINTSSVIDRSSNSAVIFNLGEKSKTVSIEGTKFSQNITVSSNSGAYAKDRQTKAFNCGQSTEFTFAYYPDMVSVDVEVDFKCSGSNTRTGINSYITLTPVGSAERSYYYLREGYGSGMVQNGVTYKIEAQVDDKIYTSQFTMDKKNFVLPAGYDLTGTATYNPATNRLKIIGMVQKDCN